MTKNWSRDRAAKHIESKIADVDNVTIVDFTRDCSLENIPANKAYKMDGVHLYAHILNLDDMLRVTEDEGVTCHKRTLRFLNLHYRAAARILRRCEVKRVDFHNQRLHSVVYKPYNSEEGAEEQRVNRAVAVGQLVIDVLLQTGDDDEHIPAAHMRVGIDTGTALAVNNGRRGGREPLFLGRPANIAAKLASNGTAKGIYLSNEARVAISLKEVDDAAKTPLSVDEITTCQEEAGLDVTADQIVKEWREDLQSCPIGAIVFSRAALPLSNLDISSLTPGNSRRQEAVSVYADIDGFTAYIERKIENDPEKVVKAFHVIRAELDRVMGVDFEGRRIRFIGDCLHGITCEGNGQTTDEEATVSMATLCAGALRSSFDLALEKLDEDGVDIEGLGLAIGFEYGPMTVTRLGLKGDRVRCSVSRGVLAAEDAQCDCNGTEAKIGELAYGKASEAVRDVFGKSRKVSGLDYNEAVEALAEEGDETANAIRMAAYASAAPAVGRAAAVPLMPYCRE